MVIFNTHILGDSEGVLYCFCFQSWVKVDRDDRDEDDLQAVRFYF